MGSYVIFLVVSGLRLKRKTFYFKVVLYSMKKKSGKLLQSPQAANGKRNKPVMDLWLILFVDCCNTDVLLLFAIK